jgi:hypothetical protein
MLRLGDWVKIGERSGAIQAWGIETGFSQTNQHPIKKASRKKAYDSRNPHVLIYFGYNSQHDPIEEWWPLRACVPIPPPNARYRNDFER